MTKREKPPRSAAVLHSAPSTAGHSLPHVDFDDTQAGKILAAAREILLRDGYGALTMDSLSATLGISKKTLYINFSSKDEMVTAVFDATAATIRLRVAGIVAGPGGFIGKLDETLRVVGEHFGSLSARFLADLQHYAPHLLQRIDAVKATNIPQGLAPVLRLGVEEGLVRDGEDVGFMIECWPLVASGLHDPARLARLDIDADEAFRRAIELFLRGILTPAGRTRLRAVNR